MGGSELTRLDKAHWDGAGVNPEAAARMQELPAKLPKLTKPTAAAAASAAEGDEDEGMGIDSGDESDAEEAEGAEPAEVVMEEAEQEAEAAAPAAAASAEDLVDETAGGAIGIDAGEGLNIHMPLRCLSFPFVLR